jgi:hypothetical protein
MKNAAGKSRNRQMFALPESPADRLTIAGASYRLVRVFKHDFWAATSLYEACETGAAFPKVVVKFGRLTSFAGLALDWYGQFVQEHEEAIYACLAGIPGVPRWLGKIGKTGYAIEYMDGLPLDHVPVPPPGWFERMRALLDAVHNRGVAYCDANKRSNMLVGAGGEAILVDYQISLRPRPDLPWPLRNMTASFIRYMRAKDIYHLYKHKRRMAPQELTTEEESLSRGRSGFHGLHRKLTKPYRALRRRLLSRLYRSGRLVSPTEALETHYMPEKASWQGAPPDKPDKPGG